MAADLTPVFSEEMDYLRAVLGVGCLPKRSRDYYLWSSGVHYYRLGRRVITLRNLSGDAPRPEVVDEAGIRARGRSRTSRVAPLTRLVEANRAHMALIRSMPATTLGPGAQSSRSGATTLP